MFRLPSQQALKTFRARLCNPLHIRHVHAGPTPFSGPPSYANIAKRFSSSPSPFMFLTEKKGKEAKERGEFIDIHDVGGVNPEDYDVLLTDMDDGKLRSEVAELIGVPYLKKTTKDKANNKLEIGRGVIYGRRYRILFPCVVGFKDQARWVFFVVNSGAPLTYLSPQAAQVLGYKREPMHVTIAGYSHPAHLSPPTSHFSDINILGYDFCDAYNIAVMPKRDEGTVNLVFNWEDKWELKTK